MKLPPLTKQEKQKAALSVIGVSLLLFVYVNYFARPTFANIQKRKTSIKELTQKLNDLKTLSVKLDALRAEIQRIELDWQNMESKLPRERALPKILDTLSRISERNRLRIASISPQGRRDEALYTEHSFGLNLTGSYHNVAGFMADLGHEPRLFHAKNLTMTSSATDPETSVSASFTVIAFEYKGG